MIHVVKRRGQAEEFDERKVYASVYAACLSVNLNEKEAEGIASKVAKEVNDWIKEKNEVTSQAISEVVYQSLKKLHEHAAFMYETHRDIS